MRIHKIDLSSIEFNYCSYSKELYDSIVRIGFSFPIAVYQNGDHYQCVDGHKRLSALTDILKDNPHYKRGREVCIVIKNNDNIRSNDCWRGRNTH
ncbi:ParB N-terminal domain-containing protein [Longibaculum muris]|uniref:ParB N-terminal domain-containing protein n=1 Tax=Longibaculum muris TaxID=1796628 RepID=UPI0012B9FD9B|nr:ParB N-terminal domain-containing protein [Longibaculum muris]